jgi:hypothetical protein
MGSSRINAFHEALCSWRAQTRLGFPPRCLRRFAMGFLRPLKSFIGMFQRLLGMLVSGLVIFFTVVCGGSTVRVCGEFVEFGSSLVRVIWHSVSLAWLPLDLRIIPFPVLSHK